MDKAMSSDERIRRAEEIYQRRKMQSYGINQTRVNVNGNSKDYNLLKKMIIQIAICIAIYLLFYIVKNSNYIFSENILKQAKEILSYDINLPEKYNEIVDWFDDKMQNDEGTNLLNNESINSNNTNLNNEDTLNDSNDNIEEVQQNEIDESEEAKIETLSIAEDSSSISQSATDAEIIKANYSIIKPLTGTITSRFGNRNPTTPSVPKYHTGIDIAANTGTKFVAAMSGIVVQVSSEGDYGNHVKIQIDDVATLYAHCSKIYVKEGDNIIQGQEIGEVGSTGNATGPHLHFEIRKSERYVNPDDVLEF